MIRSTQLTPELEAWRSKIEAWAKEYGLDFYKTIFEVLDWNQINMVAAYGGFPNRYPHWRFGMEYEQLSKSYSYGLSKIYELVINNDPCYAYLLHSNKMVDQKMVMAHVFGHCDFFKNNIFFEPTPKNMMDQMANHKVRVQRYVESLGFDRVESFIDVCLSLENLIDYQRPFFKEKAAKTADEDDSENDALRDVHKLKVEKEYLEEFINPKAFIELQKQRKEKQAKKMKKFPNEPEKDVMGFLLSHAPLSRWEYDILHIIREEAYYFAPQAQTKIMNEGWACVAGDTPVFTESGLIPMKNLVAGEAAQVCDGKVVRNIYDQNVIKDHDTISVTTRRGLTLTGSNNHRVLLADQKTWKRLDELVVGDGIAVSGGRELWPKKLMTISWTPATRVGLDDVAKNAGVSVSTVLRYRAGRPVRTAEAVEAALQSYDAPENLVLSQSLNKRASVRIPKIMDEKLAAFLGYLVGDGHISRVKRNLGVTTADIPQAKDFAALAHEIFGVKTLIKNDGNKLRVLLHSETISDFLVEALGLTTGPSARRKKVPDMILRSPEAVVRAFLSAYFDCDGYAGKQGVILSTMSDALAKQVQLLLLNFGILNRRRRQKDGCWHVHIVGTSAVVFARKIGFKLLRKQEKLEAYIHKHLWMKKENWIDEVVALKHGKADVYDISVTKTHRYVAAGFINHNSYWHSTIMTQKAMAASEIIDFADHHSGTTAMTPQRLNPYKIGLELYRDIEERWNRGQFGKEYDECQSMVERQKWDKKLGLGRKKIFDVRKIYNDITFLDTFLTADFCRRYKLFAYTYNPLSNRYEISDRDFDIVKKRLLTSLTNFGQPIIAIVDANHGNRGELKLQHSYEGIDLDIEYARETLKALYHIWKRPVLVETRINDNIKIHKFDGEEHKILDSKDGI